MNLSKTYSNLHVECLFTVLVGSIPPENVGKIGYLDVSAGEGFVLRLCGELYSVSPQNEKVGEEIHLQYIRGLVCLAEVQRVNVQKNLVHLFIIFFRGENGLAMQLGEVALTNAPNYKGERDVNLADFCIEVPQDVKGTLRRYYIICNQEVFSDDDGKNEDGDTSSAGNDVSDDVNLVLLGESGRLTLNKKNEYLYITKYTPTSSNNSILPYICEGYLDYSKERKAISALSGVALNRISEQLDQYLKLWDEYGLIETEYVLEHARSIGVMRVDGVEPQGNEKIKVFVDSIAPALEKTDAVEVVSEEPQYLIDKQMSAADYYKIQSSERTGQDVKIDEIVRSGPKPSLLLNKTNVNVGDKIILSIRGDSVQTERRRKARENVQLGKSSNPLLRNIIEGVSGVSDYAAHSHIDALSPYVRKKVFRNEPTLRQKEAIEMALNTPDIALIQGPPGTGKTTVIVAIIERLFELHDKDTSLRGEVLISGYQHDAVENLASRVKICDLPTLKFGGRGGEDAHPLRDEEKEIAKLIQDIKGGTQARNPELVHAKQLTKLQRLTRNYAFSPSDAYTEDLLTAICQEALVSSELRQEAQTLLDGMREVNTSNRTDSLILAIRALRCNEVSFADDGAEKAQNLLEILNDSLSQKERQILEHAARCEAGEMPDLSKLRTLRIQLLERFMPRPEFRVKKVNSRILRLANAAYEATQKLQVKRNTKEAIIVDFINELEMNTEAVKDALKSYNFVYAATVQQSEGKDINGAKKGGVNDYDTVIIDEAARCAPRDLLIPMTKARRRIILVGDHRQLPHIVDEDIVRRLIDDECEDDAKSNENRDIREEEKKMMLKVSMFQYMFDQLKKMERTDGIKRTVTLDAQYRTHPTLGGFVSDAFYKDYGEAFDSPLPAEFFVHELPDISRKAAVWLNVPQGMGTEEKKGSSRLRKIEAKAIAEKLHEFISSPAGKNLSFGVISFYKAQVNEILLNLKELGYTTNDLEIKPEYQARLRVGTVDAFQGMEFDVVFLSIVRTHRGQERVKVNPSRVFGHLCLTNRLCVSMSRQKRCLIAVGDAALFESPAAEENVPALHRYLKLCQTSTDGVFINYAK